MNSTFIGSIARTVLASAAGFLVGKGYITEDQIEPIIGGVTVIGVAIWGVLQKKSAAKKIEVAAQTGVNVDTVKTN